MYKEVYLKLCRGEYNKKINYTEFHHIVPRYMKGSNDPENLVELDINQHRIAHWLLWKIYGNLQDKLVYTLRSGDYESSIEIRKKLHGEFFKEKYKKDTEKNINEFYKIINQLEETELDNYTYKEYKKANIKYYSLNESRIKERKINHMANIKIKVYMFDKDGSLVNSFPSIYEASESLNYNSPGNIYSAAKGNRNSAAGFRWSFTDKPNEIKSKKRVYKKTGKQKNPRDFNIIVRVPVLQYDLDGKLIHTWKDRIEVSEKLSEVSTGMLNHVLNGRTGNNEYKGFIWKKGDKVKYVRYKNGKEEILKENEIR